MTAAADALAHTGQPPPELGKAVPIADGVLWLRLPMPYQLGHVNIYLLSADDGWAAFDTGMGDEQSIAMWSSLLSRGELASSSITHLLISHFHVDHIGMAGWLGRRFGCPLTMTRTEYLQGAYWLAGKTADHVQRATDFYRSHGLSEAGMVDLLSYGPDFQAHTTGYPPAFLRAAHGDTLKVGGRAFKVMTGGGHAPEQMALLSESERLFLTGDQILEGTSANIGVWPAEPLADPVQDYHDALRRIEREVPEDVLVLPGHGLPFYGIRTRARQLAEQSARRCDLLAEACRSRPLAAAELVALIFRRPMSDRAAAYTTSVAIAYTNHLAKQGILFTDPTPDGVTRFRTR